MPLEHGFSVIRLGLRLLWRDWRSGGLGVLLAALVVAAAASSAVGFLGDRAALLLQQQGADLLAADRVVASTDTIPAAWQRAATDRGIATARTLTFPTMLQADAGVRLVALKAVSDGYPLRGALRAEDGRQRPPSAGQVWLAGPLARSLSLQIGDNVQVGDQPLTVAALLEWEPDAAGQFFRIAPRLLMNIADIPATGLLQPYSRVRHRLLLAGDTEQIQRLVDGLRPEFDASVSLLGVEDAQPAVRAAIQRANRFLGLAAVVAVLLAAVAVALAARHQTARNLDLAAMLRCVGASQAQLLWLMLIQLLALGLLAGMIGATIGWLVHFSLLKVLGELAAAGLPAASLKPWLVGVAVSLMTLLAVALPSLLTLRRVPVLRVLRRDVDAGVGRPLWLWLPGMLWALLLILWQAGDARLGAWVALGAALTVGVLLVVAWLMVRSLVGLRHRGGAGWRFGLANISRRPATSMVQAVGYGLGVMALLLLTVVRGELFDAWYQRLPEDTPNRFVIDIQPQQRDAMAAFFADHALPGLHFEPMIRGRLLAINAGLVGPEDFPDGRARRLMSREFNLSWAGQLPTHNAIVAGQWWSADEADQALLSVESGIATELGIKLGDQLRFMVHGQPMEGRVSNLRQVDWDSFRVNFFVLTTPALLADKSASYITSFHLDAGNEAVLDTLVQQFPNLTIVDVAAVISQVRAIMDRVATALAQVFLFTLLAGVVVMYAAIHSSRDERAREMAVLRALGAGSAQLRGAVTAELAVLGLVAGLIGTLGAGFAGWLLASQLLQLDYRPGPELWLAGPLLAVVLVVLAGWLGLRRVLRQSPLVVLQS